ncbi:MAG TPA: Yip1 family protein [Sphingomonadaceae bacterium]|nr:Yip1 family protein [Sphingomonadaceae bacterium]
MSLVDRAKNILLQPKSEWAVIDDEPATVNGLFTGYALVLALLPLIGSVLGGLLFGSMFGRFGASIGVGFFLVTGIVGYIVSLAVLYVMIVIIDALLPSFDGEKDRVRAAKLAIYSATPIWVVGFFSFIPGLSVLLMLIGFAYSAYLFYLGAIAVAKVPVAKAAGFTAVTIIIWLVLSWIVAAIIGAAVMSAIFGGAMMGMGALSHM